MFSGMTGHALGPLVVSPHPAVNREPPQVEAQLDTLGDLQQQALHLSKADLVDFHLIGQGRPGEKEEEGGGGGRGREEGEEGRVEGGGVGMLHISTKVVCAIKNCIPSSLLPSRAVW